jgi:hypothetical protein
MYQAQVERAFMTLERTRQVLDDCRLALEMLEAEKDFRRWRIHWAGAVALIRAVGHVMADECQSAARLKRASQSLFKKWKASSAEDEIFHQFIKRERDFILKEYQFNLYPLDEVYVAVQGVTRPLAGGPETNFGDVFPIGENIYRPLLDSYREGDDAREVYGEAIEWWEKQIQILEGDA